ncbi:MAG: Gfo/Idh/MocA family oxidoreductase [Thermomicrobiales bacterium]
MKELRAAVVGVGMIGSLHARVYAEDARTTLVAVVDPDADRARRVAEPLGAAWYTDTATMLARDTPELVSIATREQDRFAPAVACATAGAHLLLEKPLAPTLGEAKQLAAAVAATGVRTTVNFTLRSDPRYQRVKAAVDDGTIGTPRTFFARRRGTGAGLENYAPWTDLLISTAIHDIDAMIWIIGSPVERVYAEAVAGKSAAWGKEDAVMALLRFANGAIGSLETSWILPPTVPAPLDAVLDIVGTEGGAVITGANHGLEIVDHAGYHRPDLTHWPVGPRGVFGDLQTAIAGFVTDLLRGAPAAVSLEDALAAQEVVAAMKASFRSGHPVTLPFAGEG